MRGPWSSLAMKKNESKGTRQRSLSPGMAVGMVGRPTMGCGDLQTRPLEGRVPGLKLVLAAVAR